MSEAVFLRTGSLLLVKFSNIPESSLRTLEKEFGEFAFLKAEKDELAIVEVCFGNVTLPDGAKVVGRDSIFKDGNCYVQEGGCWACLSLTELLEETVTFIVRCDSNFDIIRLVGKYVEPALRIRSIAMDHLFIHSSAVEYLGKTLLFPAWGNTGKTNLILEINQRGGSIISDDWTILLAGQKLSAYPRPLNLLNYNIQTFPEWKQKIPWLKRLILSSGVILKVIKAAKLTDTPLGLRLYDVIARVIEIYSNVHVPLEHIKCFQSHAERKDVDQIFFLQKSRSDTNYNVLPVDREAFCITMAECFIFENRYFLDCLAAARFAEPCINLVKEEEIREAYNTKLCNLIKKLEGGKLHEVRIAAQSSRSTVSAIATKLLKLSSENGNPG